MIPGLWFGAYNPYEVGPESSRAFLAYQLSRAIADAYGVDVPPDDLQDRYFADEDACAAKSFNPEWADNGLARHRPFSRSMLTALLFVVLTLLMMAAIPNNQPQRSRIKKIWPTVLWVLLLFMAMMGPMAWHFLTEVPAEVLMIHLIGAFGAIPTIGFAIALCVVIYFWLERRFTQMEPPDPSTNDKAPMPDRSAVVV